MPGVLIFEALAQTAALLTFSEELSDAVGRTVSVSWASTTRVSSAWDWRPGDELILNCTFERHMHGIWKFKARAEVDGVAVAQRI